MFVTGSSQTHSIKKSSMWMAERPDVRPSAFIPMVYEKVAPEFAQWEYYVLTIDSREAPLPDTERLNALGKDGWIMVSVLDEKTANRSSLVHYYFARQAKG